MRKVISLVIISLFFARDLAPVIAVLNYALNYDYISKNLCEKKDVVTSSCHGKCFLVKRVSNQIKIKKQTKDSGSFSWQSHLLIYDFDTENYINSNEARSKAQRVYYKIKNTKILFYPVKVPPPMAYLI